MSSVLLAPGTAVTVEAGVTLAGSLTVGPGASLTLSGGPSSAPFAVQSISASSGGQINVGQSALQVAGDVRGENGTRIRLLCCVSVCLRMFDFAATFRIASGGTLSVGSDLWMGPNTVVNLTSSSSLLVAGTAYLSGQLVVELVLQSPARRAADLSEREVVTVSIQV